MTETIDIILRTLAVTGSVLLAGLLPAAGRRRVAGRNRASDRLLGV
jgi:hypothetical protein